MMNKKINAESQPELLKDGNRSPTFEEGERFIFQSQEWTIVRSMVVDSQEQRQVVSNTGEDVILSLETLRKDAESAEYILLPRDEMKEKMAKARAKK